LRHTSITAGALIGTMATVGALYLAAMNSNIERADLITTSAAAAPQSAKEALNIAILGSTGAQAGSYQDADGSVVMVLHISADRKQASLVSFPADTQVAIPGHGSGTLRSTYAMGGAKLTVSTLENTLNTRIDHAMVAEFAGLEALAKQVGPISVDNPEAFTSNGTKFDEGRIKLTPDQALTYIKRDPTDATSDSVTVRQRLVVEAGMQKGLSRDVLSNPVKLNRFVKTTTKNTTVDKGFTAGAIANIARSLRLSSDDVKLVRVPLADLETVKGSEVRKTDTKQFDVFASALSKDKLDEYLEKYPTE